MLIKDVTCARSQKSHSVDFSRYNCRFTVRKGGVIDLEKVEPIDKKRKVGDINAMATELLSRSQYEKLPTPELKSGPADGKKEAGNKKKGDQNPPEDVKGAAGKKDDKKK